MPRQYTDVSLSVNIPAQLIQYSVVKPRRACAARVTVVVLCVCLSVCLSVHDLTSTSSICEAKARYQEISNDI